MASIRDDRGYNQGFNPGEALTIRTKRRAFWMIRQMDLSQKKNILEIGCGTGDLSYILAKNTSHQVLGTDICLPFLEKANSNFQLPNLKFQFLNFQDPSEIGDLKFDYIVGNGILHHLYNDLENSVSHFKNLLNENGKILFIEPNIYNPYCFTIFRTTSFFRNLAKLEPDEMAFSKKFIVKLLRKHSYKNINVEYKDFLLPNTPTLLIKPTISIGSIIEKILVLKYLSQSIFISAEI